MADESFLRITTIVGPDESITEIDRWVPRNLIIKPQPGPQPLPATVWFHGNKSYSLDGETPELVTREEHQVLQEFLDRNMAVDYATLGNAVTNPTTVMRKLQKKFGKAVRIAGRKGSGYFVRVRSLPKKATG
jgi:hypothetical protein